MPMVTHFYTYMRQTKPFRMHTRTHQHAWQQFPFHYFHLHTQIVLWYSNSFGLMLIFRAYNVCVCVARAHALGPLTIANRQIRNVKINNFLGTNCHKLPISNTGRNQNWNARMILNTPLRSTPATRCVLRSIRRDTEKARNGWKKNASIYSAHSSFLRHRHQRARQSDKITRKVIVHLSSAVCRIVTVANTTHNLF